MMLSSTLVFASKCSWVDSWCSRDPNNCHCFGSGFKRDGNWSLKAYLFGAALCWLYGDLKVGLQG